MDFSAAGLRVQGHPVELVFHLALGKRTAFVQRGSTGATGDTTIADRGQIAGNKATAAFGQGLARKDPLVAGLQRPGPAADDESECETVLTTSLRDHASGLNTTRSAAGVKPASSSMPVASRPREAASALRA